MTPGLRVLSPGLMTTIQDLGRPGYQQLGIPTGGALDSVALRAANALAGNPPDAAALEVLYVGLTFVVEASSARISFAGAEAQVEVLAGTDTRSTRPVEMMRSVRLRRGEIVRVGALSRGAVLYIAVEGSFAVEPVLGSLSTYIRGGFGGWDGRALAIGDRLPLNRESASDCDECRLSGVDLSAPARLRVIDGPQLDYFSDEEIAAFFAGEYGVFAGDRMGLRLRGRNLNHCGRFDITSDAIAPGSIQIAGNGQPMVLLADRQTTGGYPKIATVISADLPALGRLAVGAKIGFERITLEAAESLRRKLVAEIEGLPARIAPLETTREPSPNLLQCNLISGVVDARNWTI